MNNYGRITRRRFLRQSALGLAAMSGAALAGPLAKQRTPRKKISVILATDIGDDIDDTWALGFLLSCPDLDLKLVATEYGKSKYRAKLLAKFLQTVGRSDVAIAVGPDTDPKGEGPQAPWIKDYDLGSYPGRVHSDGLQALIDSILQSDEPVALISIGPMPNVAAALKREPRIVRRAHFVGMDGSIRLGYGGSKTPTAEWNIKAAPLAAEQVLSAAWDITITPLDTCGLVMLDGARYQRILSAGNPITSAILTNYRIWSQSNESKPDPEHHSTTLFDPVAVFLAFSHKFCKFERLRIRVADDGFTRIDDRAKQMEVATAWNNLDGFRDFLVDRLCGTA